MATYQTTIGTGLFLKVTTAVNSTNIANNKKNVTVKALLVTTSGNVNATVAKSGTLTIDGTPYNFSKVIGNLGTNSSVELYSVTRDITHNADGSKKLTVSCSFAINITYSGVYKGTVTAGGIETLATIPRTSSVTCNSFYIGDSTTININRSSASFTHTVKYVYGPLTGTIVDKTTLTSIGWTAPKEDFYSQIPNGTTGYGSIICETYNGSTLIGTATTNFNAYAKESECVPSVAATVVDTNADTIKLTGDSSKIIKYLSKPKVTLSATSKYSSAIRSRKILWGDGSTSTNAEETFSNGVTSSNVLVSATDSRAYTSSVNYDLSSSSKWIEYVKLAFSKITLSRAESTLSTANIKVAGNYFNGSFGSVRNDFTLKYRYKPDESGSTFTDYIEVSPNRTNDTFDYSETISNIDYQKQYIFEFVVEDEAMIVSSGEQILEKGQAVFRIGQDYIRANGRILDSFGTEVHNGMSKYESGGATDADTTIEELILSTTNTPTSDFWYVKTMFYSNKTASSNRTQIAYPYNKIAPTYYRYYVNGTGWSKWLPCDIVSFSYSDGAGIIHFANGLLIQWGRVNITPTAANVVTSVKVTFPIAYDFIPNVSAAPNTSVPNVISTGVGGGTTVEEGKTSMMIYMTRTNTVSTTYQWTAIGFKAVI